MDTNRTRVNATDLLGAPQLSQIELFFDTVVLASSDAHKPAVLYHLKGDMAQWNDPYFDEDNIVLLGPVAHASRADKQIQLLDQTLVCYHHIISVTGPSLSNARDGNFPQCARQAIRDAIHFNKIRSTVIPEMAQNNPLTHPHTTVAYASSDNVYKEDWLKNIEHNSNASSPSIGYRSANNELYQVQT